MRCSSWSRSLGEDPAGTAARASAWLALEQRGPWGAKAPTQSLLDPELGAALERRAGEHGGRLALIKAPRTHPMPRATSRVLVSCIRPDRQFLLTGDVDDATQTLDVDWAALTDGRVDDVLASAPWLRPRTGSVLLVCSNGRRDACCSLLGLPVAVALHDQYADDVWESTHLGGHRFAPTTVVLPQGWSHARMDPVAGSDVLRAATEGRVVLERLRGHGSLNSAEQVADVVVRRTLGEEREQAVRVLGSHSETDAITVVSVATPAGPRTVSVRRVPGSQTRPESCGKAQTPLDTWVVDPLSQEES